MTMRGTVMAVAMLLSCVVSARSPEREIRIGSEICALEQQTDRAIIERSMAFLDALLADEYQHTNFIGGTTNKKTELEFFSSPEFVLKTASIDSCKVHVYQNVAVATGVNNWTDAHFRNRDLSGLYRYTTIYVLRKGRWQLVAGHASKIMPLGN